jgi:AcrR family transcriptional regulator
LDSVALQTAMSEPRQKRDPEGTRRRILEAAIEQFSNSGLAGARVGSIARWAKTNERMLYYYFGNKEQLFIAVLEELYKNFAKAELAIDMAGREPEEAIRTLARTLWTYLREHEQWLKLINTENLHEARYLRRSTQIRETMSPMITTLRSTLDRGAQAGVFRGGIDALDFYVTLTALGYYIVSNRHTLHVFTGRDYAQADAHEAMVRMHLEMVMSYLRSPLAAGVVAPK